MSLINAALGRAPHGTRRDTSYARHIHLLAYAAGWHLCATAQTAAQPAAASAYLQHVCRTRHTLTLPWFYILFCSDHSRPPRGSITAQLVLPNTLNHRCLWISCGFDDLRTSSQLKPQLYGYSVAPNLDIQL